MTEDRKIKFEPRLPEPPAPTRTIHQMRVIDADGRPWIMSISGETMAKMKAQSENARRLAAMPWYTRWPTIAVRRSGYWIGRAIGGVLKKVRRK